MPHVASLHSSSTRAHAFANARPQSPNASGEAGSKFENLLDDQDEVALAPSGKGQSAPEQTPSPATNATQTAADASSPDPNERPPVSGSLPAGPAAQSEPSGAGQVSSAPTPPVQQGATNPPVLATKPPAPGIVPPAKTGKTDGKPASTKDKTKQSKKDAASPDGAKITPALIAAAVPQQPAQISGPADQPKTTDMAKSASIQPAQTVSVAVAANAAKTAPAATAKPENADAVASADPAQGQPSANTATGAKAADQESAAQTPSQTKASEAGIPVANAVAAAKAAPESAVVLSRGTRPAGKASQEKPPSDGTKATTSIAGDAAEPSGIAAPDPNAPPTAAANTRPSASPGQVSSREAAPQTHHAAADPSSSATTDKTAPTGDPGLAGPAGAGAAVATASGSQANTTQSTSSTPSAPPPSTAPVPLAGIPLAIAGRALGGERHFDIRLDPPELGRIEVRMKVDRDGRITSHLIADRSDTLDLLRRDGAGLERALQDAGLKTAGDGLQFSLRDQSSNTGQDGRQNLTHLVVQDEVAPVRESLPLNYGRLAGRIGGLDIRV